MYFSKCCTWPALEAADENPGQVVLRNNINPSRHD
jgi:hypothetical protein